MKNYCIPRLYTDEKDAINFCVDGSMANFAHSCEKGNFIAQAGAPCANGTVANSSGGGCTAGIVADGGNTCSTGSDFNNPYLNGCVSGTGPREFLP